MIKIENLTKIYKSKKKNNCVALDNISFDLPDKGLVFIIGKSGSGKSTLLNLLGGLDSKTNGYVSVYGNEISSYNDKQLISYRSSMVGFIFQDFHLLDELTVEENISVSLKLQKEFDSKRIEEVLKQVDLEGYGNRYPNELSGGQKQRVAIARALIKNPNIILADEPTGNLDSNTTKQIIELIKTISKEKLVIIVSHNLYDAYEYADRIIELSQGKILNDLELNKDYTNNIKIEDNKLILPLLKRFSEEELQEIVFQCKKDSITKIVQDNSKYIKYEEKEYENIKIDIKKSKLSMKDTLRFSYLFGKRKIIRFILSSFMAAMMIVVLALSQSIAYFDDAKIIQEELTTNSSIYSIRKNIDSSLGEKNLKRITEEEIETFRNEDVNVYKLYNDCMYFNEGTDMTITRNLVQSIKFGSLFTSATFGTLETNVEYAKKILNLDELNIYTNGIEYKDYGVYITDYAADCAVECGFVKNYNELLGDLIEDKVYYWGYVNGIIITNYKETYKDLINKVSEIEDSNDITDEIIDFYDFIMQALGMSFTFEKDYNLLSAKTHNKSWAWTPNMFLDDKNTQILHITTASYFGRSLKDNQIIISYDMYNLIYDTQYHSQTVSTFVPHKAILEIKDDYTNTIIKQEVEIVALISSLQGSRMHVSDEFMENYRSKVINCVSLYFDTEDMSNIISIAVDNDYVTNSIKMSAVQTMTKAVTVFNTFFDIIVFVLITACIFIIVSFGVKNVKSNMYEIGVLKALGCKFVNFAIMFTLHTLLIIALIVFFSYCGYYLISGLANTVLVESLKKLAPSYVIIDLNFITFDYLLMMRDSLVVFLISFISTIIPINMLRKIEPITIIKAKE